MASTIVNTQYGPIKGSIKTSKTGTDYLSFQKIPFMKQPIGSLRFKDPEAPEPWSDPVDCTTEIASYCTYMSMLSLKLGQEDAAAINVFVRADATKANQLLPVFVYIHGGGFYSGSSRNEMCGPEYMIERDVVFVNFNYRLGVLGFLSLDDPSLKVPGNAGLKDQVFALKWIRENIKEFGGDPNNVTLCGESAGAVSVHLHMISEQSRGLFHKAILISGSALTKSWGVVDKRDFAARLARKCGWDGNGGEREILQALEKANPHTLMKSGDASNLLTDDEFAQFMPFGFQPVVEPYVSDNCFLSRDPVSIIRDGVWSKDIPCLIGGATIEGILLSFLKRDDKYIDLLQDPRYFCPYEDLKIDFKSPKALKYGKILKELYFGDNVVNMKNLKFLYEYAGDRQFWVGIYNAVQARRRDGGRTFLFRFDADTKLNMIKQVAKITSPGAAHGDMSLYFLSSTYIQVDSNSVESKTIEKVTKLIESFMNTGVPKIIDENVVWEPVTKDLNCLILNEKEFKMSTFGKQEVIEAWNVIFDEEGIKVY